MTSKEKDTKHNNNAGVCPELIGQLAEILDKSDLTDIEVEKGDLKIKVSRKKPETVAAHSYNSYPFPMAGYQPAHEMYQHTITPQPSTIPPASKAETVAEVNTGPDLSKAVPSPMVGTVYLAPAPDEPPFVNVRQQVSAGQTLLIVEAMKTMNHISAPRSGTITAILVENAQPVEFDEPLVIIE